MKMVVQPEEAIAFLENACRNWSHVPRLTKGDIADVCRALECERRKFLRALEVPTEGMKMAGAQAITLDHMRKAANYDAACDAWSAMIAAAREE